MKCLFNPSSPGPWTLVPISDVMAIRGESSDVGGSSPRAAKEPIIVADGPPAKNTLGAPPPVKEEPIKPFKTLKFWEKYFLDISIDDNALVFESNYPEKSILIESEDGKEYFRKKFDTDSGSIELEKVVDFL